MRRMIVLTLLFVSKIGLQAGNNYAERTVYAEAHYGGFEVEKRRFKKICDGWIEISPIKPQSILQTNLYLTFPVGWMYFGRYKVWKWSNYYNR